jgi:hypothetical protein
VLIKPTSGGVGVMFQDVSGVSVLVDGVPRWLEPIVAHPPILRSQFPLPIMPFEFQMFQPSLIVAWRNFRQGALKLDPRLHPSTHVALLSLKPSELLPIWP